MNLGNYIFLNRALLNQSIVRLAVLSGVILLSGCKLGGDATGIDSKVTLKEYNSKATVVVSQDGPFQFNDHFQINSVYDVSIADDNGQNCRLENNSGIVKNHVSNLLLDCSPTYCIEINAPVCGKVDEHIVCITAPCANYSYKTFDNDCFLEQEKGQFAITGECDGLEGVATFADEPVQITDDFDRVPSGQAVTVLSSSISDHVLTLSLEFSGGCKEHDFNFFASDTFMESLPVQVAVLLRDNTEDPCEAIIREEKTFDLLPIREMYRRFYGTTEGEVILKGIGTYRF